MKNKKIIEQVIFNLLKNNIKLQEKEKILIFTDNKNVCSDYENSKNSLFETALYFSEIAKSISKKVSFLYYPSLCGHGMEPPEEVWIEAFGEDVVNQLKKKKLFNKILKKELPQDKVESVKKIINDYSFEIVDVVIALSYFSTSHTQFRHFLTELCGTRYCSMPLFEESMFFSAMQEDWALLKKRCLFLKEKLKNSSFIIITSNNGTHIRFSVTGREFQLDTGDLSYKGAFSNIPAGEVFIAPVEKTANGKLVIEYSPTSKLKSPLTLYIEDGFVNYIEGNDSYKDELYKKINKNKLNSNIAEFGIGTNSKASNMLNILESEKILGTIHIALGDNSSFGGNVRTNFHEDYLVLNPTVEVYTEKKDNFFILVNGKPLF